jgi:hypothetical protein
VNHIIQQNDAFLIPPNVPLQITRTIVKEIHIIREKHYEETKNLSSEERIKRINEGAKKALLLIEKLKKTNKES